MLHRAYPANIKRIKGVDLAVVEFVSENSYSVGKLGNSQSATISKRIYVAGAPEPSETMPSRTLLVTPGHIVGRQDPNQKGYALIYTNPTRRGMSGGPVLDEEGRVIGIHGQGDRQDGSKTGLNLAIPSESFLTSQAYSEKLLREEQNRLAAKLKKEAVDMTQAARKQSIIWLFFDICHLVFKFLLGVVIFLSLSMLAIFILFYLPNDQKRSQKRYE